MRWSWDYWSVTAGWSVLAWPVLNSSALGLQRISSETLKSSGQELSPGSPRGMLSCILCALHTQCQHVSCRRCRINYLESCTVKGEKKSISISLSPFLSLLRASCHHLHQSKTETVGEIVRPRKLSLKHNCLAKLLFFVCVCPCLQ